MPSHFSHHAKDLIRRIFQADPTKRIKFNELRQHAWLRMEIPQSLVVSQQQTLPRINEQVL